MLEIQSVMGNCISFGAKDGEFSALACEGFQRKTKKHTEIYYKYMNFNLDVHLERQLWLLGSRLARGSRQGRSLDDMMCHRSWQPGMLADRPTGGQHLLRASYVKDR